MQDADAVSKEMGTSTAELVRIFLKQLVRPLALPLAPKGESEEDEMLVHITHKFPRATGERAVRGVC